MWDTLNLENWILATFMTSNVVIKVKRSLITFQCKQEQKGIQIVTIVT